MAPLRAVTNCRNVGIMESSKQSEQGRVKLALLLPTRNSVSYDRTDVRLRINVLGVLRGVTGRARSTRHTVL